MATSITVQADARIVTVEGFSYDGPWILAVQAVAPVTLDADPLCPATLAVIVRCNKPQQTARYANFDAVIQVP